MAPGGLSGRLMWFVGLWAAGVLALTAIALAIRLFLQP